MILPRLARLHNEFGNAPAAAECFARLLEVHAEVDDNQIDEEQDEFDEVGEEDQIEARIFLMQYYRNTGNTFDCADLAMKLNNSSNPLERDAARRIVNELRAAGYQLPN